ncbi:MAG: AAA family ATPase, partial [Prevotella sp.]|nr:AAA family ATPase [Prevotella sp.]
MPPCFEAVSASFSAEHYRNVYEEQFYGDKPGRYVRALIEEYAQLPFHRREEIVFKGISDEDAEYKKKLLEVQRFCDPMHLNTLSMNDLFDCSFPSKPPLIDGLLYVGTYLLAGSPKVGKSFLVAQLAYHVSTGQTLWEYPVRQGGVLYLALEDDYARLQRRMSRMF